MKTSVLSIRTIALVSGLIITGLMIGRSFSTVIAQTASTTPTIAPDFKADVTQAVNSLKNEPDGHNNQSGILGSEQERAGDENGVAKEIDGEKDEKDIEQEVEQEAHQEDTADETPAT